MSANVTELRVHGVSGVQAEAMLDRPLVTRVAGDQNAGFYRPWPGYGDPTGPGGVTLEAYRWGNLTAGTLARTLALLFLLPFMLSNLAIWLRPASPGSGALVKILCKVLAASITSMFVLSIVGVAMDLVGWQCVPYRRCTAGRTYLSWLEAVPVGPRLALLAIVPIAAIRLVWWLGSRTAKAYEGFTLDVGQPADERLDAPGFWNTEAEVGRLRTIHVAIAFATVDATLLAALAPHNEAAVGYVLLAVTVALLGACLVLLCVPPPADFNRTRAKSVMTGLRATAAGLTVLSLAYAVLQRPAGPVTGQLPGFGEVVTGMFVAQTGLLTALAGVVLWQQWRAGIRHRAFLRGMGTPVVGAAAVGLAAAFSAALVYRVADVLDRGLTPSPARPVPPGTPPLLPPVSYRWAALGAVAAVLTVTVVGLLTNRITRSRRSRTAAEIIRQDFPDPPPSADRRVSAVREVLTKSRLADRLGPLLVAYFVLSLLSLTATVFELVGLGPTQLANEVAGRRSTLVRVISSVTDVGTFLIGVFVLGLVVVGILAYQFPDIRRIAGVLWDLGTFWPRTTHPFAPPCYAERAVPELAKRIRALSTQGAVLLSGHSHGSVLAAATVLHLPAEALRKVALLTYGSPLHRLYARLIPAYFGEDVLRAVGDRVDWRWRNLWRHTDPVSGPIFSSNRAGEPPDATGPSGKVDRRLKDPRDVVVDTMDTVPPPIERHWPYHTDARYTATVSELARELDTSTT